MTVADGWYKGVRAFRVHDVKETKELLDATTHFKASPLPSRSLTREEHRGNTLAIINKFNG